MTTIGLSLTRYPYIAAALLAADIFHVTVWNICAVSLRQRLLPEGMRGRQNSLFNLSGLNGLVRGAAIAGPVSDAGGQHLPFAIAAVIFFGCMACTSWLLRTGPDLTNQRK